MTETTTDELRSWTVPVGPAERLDRALVRAFPDLSRSRVQALLAEGRARVDGELVKPSFKVMSGQSLTLTVPPVIALELTPEQHNVPVLYEDDDLVVIVKPAGMVVHPSAGHDTGTLVHALLGQVKNLSGIGGMERPGIVHRLDGGTSGIMVVAKGDRAHRALSEQFAIHSVERRYIALIHRVPLHDRGTFRSRIWRDPNNRLKMASVIPGRKKPVIEENWDDEHDRPLRRGPGWERPEPEEDEVESLGKDAITHWTLRYRGDRVAAVECKLETGRTHQVRVHLSEAGHPILGDTTYSRRDCIPTAALRDAVTALTHPMLHAFRLAFDHPDGRRLSFTAPPPADFVEMARLIGFPLTDFGTA